MPQKRRVKSIAAQLLHKSREAALSAVQIFNNPLMQFKSETYIVLMIIAWTYLLHAYYRKNGVEYRYHSKRVIRRRFDRTKRGAFKHWDLEKCLKVEEAPIDTDTTNNLCFLIGLRHEIEHQMAIGLDDYLSGRYQACARNYNHYIKDLFDKKFGIDKHLAYSIQFLELSYEQLYQSATVGGEIPQRVRNYITEFDKSLSEDQFNSERFSYRLIFTKKLVNHPGQADRVIEFLDPDSELAEQMNKQYVVLKETEHPKYLPGDIVRLMEEQGYNKFRMYDHTQLWKSREAKNPGKGYGVQIGKTWYWYEVWVREVRKHCKENQGLYKAKGVSS